MNSSSCKRLLIERGMLVNLGGNRGYRVSLASIRELIQERAVKNPRKAYIKKGNRNEA
jgi:hypothetical protein